MLNFCGKNYDFYCTGTANTFLAHKTVLVEEDTKWVVIVTDRSVLSRA